MSAHYTADEAIEAISRVNHAGVKAMATKAERVTLDLDIVDLNIVADIATRAMGYPMAVDRQAALSRLQSLIDQAVDES